MNSFKTIELVDNKLKLIDQTKLPLVEEYILTDDVDRLAVSIERLEVRGAPAIGVTAAYAFALGFKNIKKSVEDTFYKVYERLRITRPTAVNLFWALDEMKKVYEANKESEKLYEILLHKAVEIHDDDIKMCQKLNENSLPIFKKKSRVLTHCNAGALATAGSGTAVGVIIYAFQNGWVEFAHADETRPLLQGSRLTAFEFDKAGVPFAINVDSSAAVLMQKNKIDLVITGADRVANNGDAANKIGTYSVAVNCKHHGIPFYIVAPSTTVDKNCPTGDQIEIEERDKSEINRFRSEQITKEEYPVFAPAFDVTPNELIAGIITEEKLYHPPYNFSNA